MRGNEAARCSCNYIRARSSMQTDTDIVARNLERDWKVGTLWAGLGFVLVIGPMLVMHALEVF